ncbi:hypothetical protein F5884DRAFT_274361 [Xylogone sp. PMI_703]|nr:hypothetical protein F5884DRAFT_274361 [Xylogone sp. PMI_703]
MAPATDLEPILASHLLELETRNRAKFTGDGRVVRLRTGCEGIDEYVLGGGGVERGVVMGVSAGGEEGCGDVGRVVSLHLLASVLLSQLEPTESIKPASKAIVIDTTGSFPVSSLAKVLRSRILATRERERRIQASNENHSKNAEQTGGTNNDVVTEVQKCLEMVSISRVFDFEGMWEVLGEVRSGTAEKGHLDTDIGEQQDDGEIMEGQENHGIIIDANKEMDPTPEILDSEEDESVSSDRSPMDRKTIELRENETRERNTSYVESTNKDNQNEGIEIVILDNMTNIINELFARKEKVEAHTLMSLFSQTLYNISRTENILTILHNTASQTSTTVPTAASDRIARRSNTSKPTPASQTQLQHQLSIFSSSPKPSLGKLFSSLTDIHVLISSHQKKRSDIPLEDPADLERIQDRNIYGERAYLFEVLKDECPHLPASIKDSRSRDAEVSSKGRLGYREQRWTPFEVANDGITLKDYESKHVVSNETKSLRDLKASVLPMGGFAGRRV